MEWALEMHLLFVQRCTGKEAHRHLSARGSVREPPMGAGRFCSGRLCSAHAPGSTGQGWLMEPSRDVLYHHRPQAEAKHLPAAPRDGAVRGLLDTAQLIPLYLLVQCLQAVLCFNEAFICNISVNAIMLQEKKSGMADVEIKIFYCCVSYSE